MIWRVLEEREGGGFIEREVDFSPRKKRVLLNPTLLTSLKNGYGYGYGYGTRLL